VTAANLVTEPSQLWRSAAGAVLVAGGVIWSSVAWCRANLTDRASGGGPRVPISAFIGFTWRAAVFGLGVALTGSLVLVLARLITGPSAPLSAHVAVSILIFAPLGRWILPYAGWVAWAATDRPVAFRHVHAMSWGAGPILFAALLAALFGLYHLGTYSRAFGAWGEVLHVLALWVAVLLSVAVLTSVARTLRD
jgi:hypothetical protein